MKKILIAAALALAVSAQAALPTFLTKSATGVTNAVTIFPHDPNSQIRVVSAIVSSDLASSTLSFYNGGTATYLTATNATTATNIVVAATNGIATGNLLYIQGSTSNVVLSVNYVATNTVGFTTTVGIPGVIGAEVEVLGAATTTLGVGAKTNVVYASEGLVVGNYGRCMYIKQTGTSYSSLDAITVHYDSAGAW